MYIFGLRHMQVRLLCCIQNFLDCKLGAVINLCFQRLSGTWGEYMLSRRASRRKTENIKKEKCSMPLSRHHRCWWLEGPPSEQTGKENCEHHRNEARRVPLCRVCPRKALLRTPLQEEERFASVVVAKNKVFYVKSKCSVVVVKCDMIREGKTFTKSEWTWVHAWSTIQPTWNSEHVRLCRDCSIDSLEPQVTTSTFFCIVDKRNWLSWIFKPQESSERTSNCKKQWRNKFRDRVNNYRQNDRDRVKRVKRVKANWSWTCW